MVEAAVEEAWVWVAVRGLPCLPSSRLVVRFYRAWSFQFARLPSSYLLVLGLWSELEAVEAVEEAETVAWEYRVQLLPGLQVYATESAIGPSGVSGEPSRPQAARPLSWS
jgi:hypothetical protein